jgi:hypothetical protein
MLVVEICSSFQSPKLSTMGQCCSNLVIALAKEDAENHLHALHHKIRYAYVYFVGFLTTHYFTSLNRIADDRQLTCSLKLSCFYHFGTDNIENTVLCCFVGVCCSGNVFTEPLHRYGLYNPVLLLLRLLPSNGHFQSPLSNRSLRHRFIVCPFPYQSESAQPELTQTSSDCRVSNRQTFW